VPGQEFYQENKSSIYTHLRNAYRLVGTSSQLSVYVLGSEENKRQVEAAISELLPDS